MAQTGSIAQFSVRLTPGDPAPWFYGVCTSNPNYAFSSAAGRYIVLCFLGSAGDERGAAALQAVIANRHLFDDVRASFFGVSVDPSDRDTGRVREILPGIRFFWDVDGAISRAYGSIPLEGDVRPGKQTVRRFWIVLDPMLRVMELFPFVPDGSDRAAVFAYLSALPPPQRFAGIALPAPILFLPNVFESQLCRKLIRLYEAHGGQESGFMRDVAGKTVLVSDPAHKRRRDYVIDDRAVISRIQDRIRRRIAPEIAKVHQFHVTRSERFIVSCYAAEEGGHFRAHRDNTTKGTAHRRFAVSVNLNADFDGGELSFPEYGRTGYRAPPGGAVVFSCSLLHAVSPVTRGRRYAFLPFLYDDAAAELRERNNPFLEDGKGVYRRV